MNINQKRIFVMLLAVVFAFGIISVATSATKSGGTCCKPAVTKQSTCGSCAAMSGCKDKAVKAKCTCCDQCKKSIKNCTNCKNCCGKQCKDSKCCSKNGKCCTQGKKCCDKGSKCCTQGKKCCDKCPKCCKDGCKSCPKCATKKPAAPKAKAPIKPAPKK